MEQEKTNYVQRVSQDGYVEAVPVTEADIARVDAAVSKGLRASLSWMVLGLVTTIIIGAFMLMNPNWIRFTSQYFTYIMLAEVGVVFLFSARAMKANYSSLLGMFFLYSMLNGLTLTLIGASYGMTAVVSATIGTVSFFAGAAIVGNVVKRDMTRIGNYALAAVVAMILCSLFMMFTGFNSVLNMVLGYLGIVVFAVFTAVDINRIKRNLALAALTEDESVLERISLLGALSLYLDVINLFLSFLRVFGSNRD